MALTGIEAIKGVKDVSRETLDRLTVFHDLLKQWQAHINLIAPSTVNQIWERHIADSLQSCCLMDDAKTVVDLGSGAGFPGLTQAILMAEHGIGQVDLVESVGKKCAFLNTVVRETGLKAAGVNVKVHHARIENILNEIAVPDYLSARALAPLDKLFEYGEPCLSHGAIGIFPKGRECDLELDQARDGWKFDVESIRSRFDTNSVILRISNLERM